MPKPLRKVVSSELRATRSIGGGPFGSRTSRWWTLTLECGHSVERRAKYTPSGTYAGGIRERSMLDVLPAPKSARCEVCKSKGMS